MKKKVFGLALCALLLALSFAAQAQQPKKVTQICYLGAADASTSAVLAKPFRQRLREIGYVEGQNLTLEFRQSEPSPPRIRGGEGIILLPSSC
jgi:putative ABC transport system substrate-binding protein